MNAQIAVRSKVPEKVKLPKSSKKADLPKPPPKSTGTRLRPKEPDLSKTNPTPAPTTTTAHNSEDAESTASKQPLRIQPQRELGKVLASSGTIYSKIVCKLII